MGPADPSWLDAVRWNSEGLVPVVVVETASGLVLMQAWMNRAALAATVREQRAVYWSRSRGALWRKGEQSGHVQRLCAVRLDCDGDTLLLEVVQEGGVACHTGHQRCFYRRLAGAEWLEDEPVRIAPEAMYGSGGSEA